jgi:hypothetical protein
MLVDFAHAPSETPIIRALEFFNHLIVLEQKTTILWKCLYLLASVKDLLAWIGRRRQTAEVGKKKQTDHIVLVTTDQALSASWIVRHYEERPEIEQDYEQMKSGGWQLQKLSSTRYSEIVFYVLTMVLSYSLYHLFANTQAGARFADKTRQAIAFEQLRTQRTHIIVYAGGYFEIFETLRFVQMVLQLPATVQAQLHTWLSEHLDQIQKRE